MLTLWLKEKSRLAPDKTSPQEKGTLSQSHNRHSPAKQALHNRVREKLNKKN